ncbi:MAG: Imm42 family immunity protein [Methylotenera sp.]
MQNLIVVGEPNLFAIESCVSEFYKEKGQLAIGYFIVYVGGLCYGIKSPDATLLACSFYQIDDILKKRTNYTSLFSDVDAQVLADMYLAAIYAENSDDSLYFGKSAQEIKQMLYESDVIWAPDGDAAFDDGSHILLFNFNHMVRLIAFKNSESYKATNLQELLIPSDSFYDILDGWKSQFENQRRRNAVNGVRHD